MNICKLCWIWGLMASDGDGLQPSASASPLSPTSPWQKQTLAFDAACLLEACQPGHLLRPQAKFHTRKSTMSVAALSKHPAMTRVKSHLLFCLKISRWNALLFIFFSLKDFIGKRKEGRKVIYFFCFDNLVWHILPSKNDKLVVFFFFFASFIVMWLPMFSPSLFSCDLKSTWIFQTVTFQRWLDASFLCKLRVFEQDLAAFLHVWVRNRLFPDTNCGIIKAKERLIVPQTFFILLFWVCFVMPSCSLLSSL